MTQSALSDFAPALRGGAAAVRGRPRAARKSIARWIRAVLEAHARRQVVLALGERVHELKQAIRIGAEARRHLETQKENRK
jgi:hypothetical protein